MRTDGDDELIFPQPARLIYRHEIEKALPRLATRSRIGKVEKPPRRPQNATTLNRSRQSYDGNQVEPVTTGKNQDEHGPPRRRPAPIRGGNQVELLDTSDGQVEDSSCRHPSETPTEDRSGKPTGPSAHGSDKRKTKRLGM